MRIPPGSTEAGEGWHQVNITVVRDGTGQLLHFGGRTDDAEAVAQPLDDCTGGEHRTLNGILYATRQQFLRQVPGDSADESATRYQPLITRVQKHEAAGSVSVLAHARAETRLPETGCVLVAGNGQHRQFRTEVPARYRPEAADRRPDFRQDRRRNIERFQQLRRPVKRLRVIKHRPAGVRDVSRVNRAISKPPQEPAVHGSEREFAPFGPDLK